MQFWSKIITVVVIKLFIFYIQRKTWDNSTCTCISVFSELFPITLMNIDILNFMVVNWQFWYGILNPLIKLKKSKIYSQIP